MAEKQFVVVIGVPSIKKYVFGTDRLREIRGASALLYNFNQFKMVEFLKSSPELSSMETVFVGGGAGQFVIRATEANLRTCLKKLERVFAEETSGGAHLIWGMADYGASNYQQAIKIADLEAFSKSQESPFHPFTLTHTGFIRECDSCSQMASHLPLKYGDEEQILCDVCYSKVAYNYENAKMDLWQDLSQYLKGKGIDVQRPKSFEEIGELCKARRGYTALVYADGNSIGKILKAIEDEKSFKFLSEIIDTSIREACHGALYDACFVEAKEEPRVMPAEILMLGGDDLLVYLTAETAFPFAIKMAEKFNEKTIEKLEGSSTKAFLREKLGGKGLYLSLGVAYGKSHTPFSILLDQAEELLKSSKKAGSKDKMSKSHCSPTYIDYHLSSNFNQVSVENTRKNHLELSGKKLIRLYQKPYSLEDAKAILDAAKKLGMIGVTATRLRRLGYAPSLGKMNGTLEFLKLYTRAPREQREVIWDILSRFGCAENIPWKVGQLEDSTMLVDLLEIAAFSHKGEMSAEGGNDAA